MVFFNIFFNILKTLNNKGGELANYLSSNSYKTLPPVTNEILILPAHELAKRIRKRQLTSEQVVRAYINRIRIVQAYLNAIIDERFDDAIKDAKAIDKFLETTELSEQELAQLKPFLGLPFTAKDSIQIAGMKWSSGCVRRQDIISDEDSPIIKNYRKAGAIPVALTNVPELLLWFATSNKLYGTTNNPFDLSRVPGGSSGGEAALVAACGSPLSICTDIGGSIRMPAFHCGLFGHKPTQMVIDHHGTFPRIEEGLEELFTYGPITRFVDDILPALRVMAGEENFKKFNNIEEPVDLSKLRIFYLDECGDYTSTTVEPYISQSIRDAAEHLGRKYNVPVERAQFKYFKDISYWYVLLFSELREVSSLITENTYKINPFLELAKSLVGQSDFSPSALTVAAAQTSTHATWDPKSSPHYDKARRSLELAKKEFNSILGDDGVLLYVTLPRTAPTHYAALFEFTNVCCPMVMNYLNAPTTQVPTGTKLGLPYGIQVSASPFNDRLTLAVAKEFESVFGGWIKPCELAINQSATKEEDKGVRPTRIESLNSSSAINFLDKLSESSSITSISSTTSSATSYEQVVGPKRTLNPNVEVSS